MRPAFPDRLSGRLARASERAPCGAAGSSRAPPIWFGTDWSKGLLECCEPAGVATQPIGESVLVLYNERALLKNSEFDRSVAVLPWNRVKSLAALLRFFASNVSRLRLAFSLVFNSRFFVATNFLWITVCVFISMYFGLFDKFTLKAALLKPFENIF